MNTISVVIPAKNEAESLKKLLPEIQGVLSGAEVIVVNDGSTDETSRVCLEFGVIEVKHQYSKGNGAAVKSGARAATGEILVFMDGDGQHRPNDILRLLTKLDEGYDMVVGSRDNASQANLGRLAANKFYNRMAGWMVGHNIPDLTSGFRAVKAKYFKEYLYLLPNGFSYPTTITMAFFRVGYSVGYIDIIADKRMGDSHINYVKDGIRFLLIIFKVGMLYSPIKLFFPISVAFFGTGFLFYLYTYLMDNRFTNMGVLLFVTSLLIFLLGLVSEQVSSLVYKTNEK